MTDLFNQSFKWHRVFGNEDPVTQGKLSISMLSFDEEETTYRNVGGKKVWYTVRDPQGERGQHLHRYSVVHLCRVLPRVWTGPCFMTYRNEFYNLPLDRKVREFLYSQLLHRKAGKIQVICLGFMAYLEE